MEPWTDGAPLIFKSKLPIARELRGTWTALTRELRGWSLGLMGRP